MKTFILELNIIFLTPVKILTIIQSIATILVEIFFSFSNFIFVNIFFLKQILP